MTKHEDSTARGNSRARKRGTDLVGDETRGLEPLEKFSGEEEEQTSSVTKHEDSSRSGKFSGRGIRIDIVRDENSRGEQENRSFGRKIILLLKKASFNERNLFKAKEFCVRKGVL